METPKRLRDWLIGSGADPSLRWRYWTEVEALPPSDPRVRTARRRMARTGWVAGLLAGQFPDGHWSTPGASGEELYLPKYLTTNWRALVLAELGMDRSDPRIRRTAELILRRWGRGFDYWEGKGEICITGNFVRTMVRFGYFDHPTVQRSIDWIVRTQKADGGWHCFRSRVGTLDGWEGLAAFAEIPESERTHEVQRAIERGAEFYLSRRLSREAGPRYEPWFRIHYPTHYYYDLLVGLRMLTRLGYGADPRLAPAFRWLRDRRRADGTWELDADHPDRAPRPGGYPWLEPVFPLRLEPPKWPSRLATVGALSVLRHAPASSR